MMVDLRIPKEHINERLTAVDMLYPMTWRPQPWESQPSVHLGDQSSQFWPSREPTSSTAYHAWPSAASASWAPAMMPHAQDFIPPATLQPVQSELRNGPSWSNMTPRSQLAMTPNADCSFTAATGTSNLSRLPFFRSQVMKLESDAARGKKQRSKVGSNVVKMEMSPEVKVASLLQMPSAVCDRRQMVSSSDLWQAAPFPGAMKRPMDLIERDLLRGPPQTVKVHVQSLKQPHGAEATLPLNWHSRITVLLPKVAAAAAPELLRSTLGIMRAVIVYAQYECADECRSRGICVHFSFLLGCRQAPDGLICPSCQAARVEKPYAAHRFCPRHNKRTLSQFTPNLPEDYLPSGAQLQRAFEIFEKACNGNWEGVPNLASKRAPDVAIGHIEDVNGIENLGKRNKGNDNVLPSAEANDHRTGYARKRQRISPKEGNIARKHSSDKENDVDENSDSAVQVGRDISGRQGEDSNRTPRASTVVRDHVDAGAVVGNAFFSTSFPSWSPEPKFDLFS